MYNVLILKVYLVMKMNNDIRMDTIATATATITRYDSGSECKKSRMVENGEVLPTWFWRR